MHHKDNTEIPDSYVVYMHTKKQNNIFLHSNTIHRDKLHCMYAHQKITLYAHHIEKLTSKHSDNVFRLNKTITTRKTTSAP